MPNLSPEQISELSSLVAQYITNQRNKYAFASSPLNKQQRAAMAGFFTPEVLDQTRLVVLQEVRVANPEFYPALKTMGFDNLPDQSSMSAITFWDTVVSHQSFTDDLLFHELVHAEQYRQLGLNNFSYLYVRGFLCGGGYYAIPLEQNAYVLGARYERAPKTHFSVAEEVSRWIVEDRF